MRIEMNKKTIFDLFKKMADEVALGSERLVQKVTEKLNDESMMHREVLALYYRMERILKNKKYPLDPEIKNSLKSILDELKTALERDSESAGSKYPAAQLALAEQCMQIIYDSKSKLESASAIWNVINTFIKGITAIENAFDTEEADLITNKEFIEYKNSLADLKSKLSDVAPV